MRSLTKAPYASKYLCASRPQSSCDCSSPGFISGTRVSEPNSELTTSISKEHHCNGHRFMSVAGIQTRLNSANSSKKVKQAPANTCLESRLGIRVVLISSESATMMREASVKLGGNCHQWRQAPGFWARLNTARAQALTDKAEASHAVDLPEQGLQRP